MTNLCTVQSLTRMGGALVVGLAAILGTTPAIGQATKAFSTNRTVTWYADHTKERAQTELACFDDPGHLERTPDCKNAHQAGVLVAVRQARSHAPLVPPSNPAFWSADPEARHNKLMLCRRSPQLDGCAAARRSLLIEAGQGR